MPRNGSGTYSLPAGNPVVTLTTISSAWANSTLSDIATALTQSVAANGVTPLTGPLRLVDGGVANPGLSFVTENTSGIYRIGAGQIGISITGTKHFAFTATQLQIPDGVVGGPGLSFISEPTSGLFRSAAGSLGLVTLGTRALGLNSNGISVPDGSAAAPSYGFQTDGRYGMYYSSGFINFTTLGIQRMTIDSNGSMVIAQPSSGTALTLQTVNGRIAIAAGGILIGQGVAFTSGYSEILTNTTNFNIGTAAANTLNLITNGNGRLNIDSIGQITIQAPTAAGVSLTVNGRAGFYSLYVQGSVTTGQSYGPRIQAGSNASDVALLVQNAASTYNYFEVTGDGRLLMNDLTASGGNLFEVGFRDMPLAVSTASNYTFALTDRGKFAQFSGASLVATVPANASVAFPIGTVLGVDNEGGTSMTIVSGDTLILAGAGTTGTRTVAPGGWATCVKVGTTSWKVMGPGVS